jgi:hypothetical protein
VRCCTRRTSTWNLVRGCRFRGTPFVSRVDFHPDPRGEALRNKEGKDGNPVNEVRVLSESLVQGDGTLTVPKSIKLDPESSVLHHAPGDESR